jgi:tetratricopeptide (TPR) repeat protein
MRRISFSLLFLLSLLALPGRAQQGDKPAAPAKPLKLTRKERKELAQRAELDLARQQVRVLSEKDREMSEAYFVEGVKFVLLEDYNKALERLLKAYALNPSNAAINYKIAETNLLSGNLKDATNFAQIAVKLDPKNAYYYLLLAQIYASQKQYDQAAKVYTSLIRDVPV